MLTEQALSKAPATRPGDVQAPTEHEYPHLMIDTETMGRCPGAVPIAIGAVPFSVDRRETGPMLRVHVDLDSAMAYDELSVEAGTINFWMRKSDGWLQLQKSAVPLKKGLSLLRMHLDRQCKSSPKVWARGTDFDFGLVLRPAFEAVGRGLPWSYSNQRDHRTLGLGRPEHDGTHDPVADAYAQARQIADAGGPVRDLLS